MSRYKPYPVYKDSGVEWIGEVPEHWEVKRLRHVATFKNSNVDKKSYDGQQAIHLCNYTDVYYNEFITSGLSFMPSTASAAEIEQFALKRGDVIITKDSEDPADIGIPSIVSEELGGVVCGYHLTVIRGADLETARVIHRALQSSPTKAHFFVEATGITRYGLNQDAIGDTPICLPPPQERKNLADHIDRETARIDALIAKKSRFVELLREKRQAFITHAVTKGLDPSVKMKDSGVEWIGEVPEHWERWKMAHAFSRIGSGTTPTASEREWYEGGTVNWVTTGELREGVIYDTEAKVTFEAIKRFSALRIHPAGSVVIAMYGATIGRLGVLGEDSTTNQACCVLSGSIAISQKFAFYWLLASKKAIIDLFASGGAQPNINMEKVAELRVPCPSVQEQTQIADYLDGHCDRIDVLIAKVQRSIDLLQERRSAFITAAVTGQINLRESK